MTKRSEPVVHSDPGILGGTPVFVGTHVPFQTLIDYLEGGAPLAEFLDDFPTVSRDKAVAALEHAKDALLARLSAEELGLLAERLASTGDPAEAVLLRERLTRGFYGI